MYILHIWFFIIFFIQSFQLLSSHPWVTCKYMRKTKRGLSVKYHESQKSSGGSREPRSWRQMTNLTSWQKEKGTFLLSNLLLMMMRLNTCLRLKTRGHQPNSLFKVIILFYNWSNLILKFLHWKGWQDFAHHFSGIRLEFIKPIKDVTVKERETAEFSIELSHEKVQVTWYKNDVRLHPSKVVHMSEQGKIHTLSFKEVSIDDTSLIKAEALGKSCEAMLTVLGKCRLYF